jgi:ABC-type multidrug transport system ATPase subunit
MSVNAIEIRGLEKSFSKFKLGPFDLTVPNGVIYGFVGPNGAGKTTTIDMIFGMGGKDAGSITVLGLNHIADEVRMKQQVGYVSPDLSYVLWGRVGKAIQFVRGFYPSWDHKYCERLLETFHLGWDDKITSLSFGARIKLSLVLALSWRPKLLILDEPTVGLDAITKQQVFSELLAAVSEEERTVFISSHSLTDLERFADYVGMIKNGKMVFEGAISGVIERFRMVDFIAKDAFDFKGHPGFVVQTRQDNRWRVLVDIDHAALDWIQSRGVTPISDSPVTLEELFVALGKD